MLSCVQLRDHDDAIYIYFTVSLCKLVHIFDINYVSNAIMISFLFLMRRKMSLIRFPSVRGRNLAVKIVFVTDQDQFIL